MIMSNKKYSRVLEGKSLVRVAEYQNELIWEVAELMKRLQKILADASKECERIIKATDSYDIFLEKVNEDI